MRMVDASEKSKKTDEIWRASRIHSVLVTLLASLAVTLMLLFIVSSLRRIACPVPIDHVEGTLALDVARVAHGLPLYGRPTFRFIPYMYAPAYFYVSGLVAKYLGPGLLAPRIVSFVCTLGCFGAIYTLIFLETKNRLASLTGTGLYAAVYPATQYWFDQGRVDSLFVLLILLALLATRRLHPVFAGLLWAVAFLTKQTIAPVALILLCFDWKHPRRVLSGAGTFLLASGASSLWLDRATHGWFHYYVFTVPHANSDLAGNKAILYLSAGLLAPLGTALIVIAAAILMTGARWRSRGIRFYLLAGSSLTALCWLIGAHVGSLANSSMPAYAILAVAFGIAFARLSEWLPLASAPGKAGYTLLLLAACSQLGSQLYDPRLLGPSPADRASQEQLVVWLRSFPGDVLVAADPYDAVLAGKPPHFELMAIHDAMRPANPAVNLPLLHEIRQSVDNESLDAIILAHLPSTGGVEGAYDTWLPADWQAHYPVLGLIPDFNQVNGLATRPPRYLLLPCRSLSLNAVRRVYILSSGPSSCGKPI